MSRSLPTMVESFLLRELRTLRRELESYPEEAMIWALPPGIGNSAGTLALHLAGNLQNFVGARLGGSGYVRDRDAEFSARYIPLQKILSEIDAAESAVQATLSRLAEEDLSGDFPEVVGGLRIETGEFLMGLAVHLAYHLGQISYHRRVVTGVEKSVGALSLAELGSARPATEEI